MMEDFRKDLATILRAEGAIRFGQFRLKLHDTNPEAPLSPLYVDLRTVCRLPGYCERIAKIIDGMSRKSPIEFDVVADIPLSISPVATTLSHLIGCGQVTPRPTAKTHGGGDMVLGKVEKGHVALLLDDVITKADSKLEAARTLEEAGLSVRDVFVVVDREQGGKEELAAHGMTLYSIFTLKELCDFYREQNLITEAEYQACAVYFEWESVAA